jgi:hypothetical protein
MRRYEEETLKATKYRSVLAEKKAQGIEIDPALQNKV